MNDDNSTPTNPRPDEPKVAQNSAVPSEDKTAEHKPLSASETVARTPSDVARQESNASELAKDGVPGYTLLGTLGNGGMGVVHKALHIKLNRVVALKMMLGGENATRNEMFRFLAEAEAVAAIKHENVVQVYDYGEHDNKPFMALEFCSGGTISKLLPESKDQATNPREMAALIAKVARGVAAAHAIGIIHRDLKPGNVFLDESGVPKVADFGLAKRGEGADVTQAGVGLGTPAYMAPEQARDAKFAGPQADVWALGVMLYEALTGGRPFTGTVQEIIANAQNTEPIPPRKLIPTIPLDLELICLKCLSKAPHERYATANELVADLERFLRGEAISVRPLGVGERVVRWVRRKPTLAAAYGLSTLAVVLALGVFFVFGLYREANSATTQLAKTNGELEIARDEEKKQRGIAEASRRAEALTKTDITLTLATNHDRLAEPGEMAVVLAHALDGLASDDVTRESAIRYGLAVGRSQLRPLLRIQSVNGNIRGCVMSPDGRRVAVGTASKRVHFFDTQTGDAILNADGRALEYSAGQENLDAVSALAFAPDGSALAVSTDRGQIHLVDPVTAKPVRKTPITFGGQILSLEFAKHGQWLVVAGRKGTAAPLAIYDAKTGEPVHTFDVKHDLYAAAVSDDGRWLVAGGGFPPTSGLLMWDLHAPNTAPIALPQMVRIVTLAFRPGTSSEFVTGDFNGGVAFWKYTNATREKGQQPQAATTQPGWSLHGSELRHRDAVRFVTYSEDGRYLILGGEDGSARLYDAESRLPLGQRFVHFDQIRGGAVSIKAQRIVTGDFRGDIRFWSLAPVGEAVRILPHGGPVRVATFHENGETILTGSNSSAAGLGGGRVWKWREGRVVELPHNADVMAAAFRPQHQQAVTGANDGTAILWDCETGKPLQQLPKTRLVYSLSFLSADRFVIAGLGKEIRVFDFTNQTQLFTHSSSVTQNTYSFVWKVPKAANGHFLSDGGRILVAWKPVGTNYNERKLLELPDNPKTKPEIRLAAVDHRGQRLIASDNEANVYLLEIASGGISRLTVQGATPHDTGRVCADFATNGLLATGGTDGTVRIWQANGEPAPLSQLRHPSSVELVRFSPDGRWLVTGCQDGGVRLWDVSNGVWTGAAWYHGSPVTCLEFHSSGNTLLSAARDGIARVVTLPQPLAGTPKELLATIEADAGLFTSRVQNGDTATFTVPKPLTQLQFAERRQLRPQPAK